MVIIAGDGIRSADVQPYGAKKPDSPLRKRIRQAIRSEVALSAAAEDRLARRVQLMERRAVNSSWLRARVHWLHWAALVSEFIGSLFIYLEARRFESQFQGIYKGWWSKIQPGYDNWWHNCGSLGFVLLARGVLPTGAALALRQDSRSSPCYSFPKD